MISNTPYTVDVITNEEALASIREDWDRLTRAAEIPNVFTTYEWFTAWYAHFHEQEGAAIRPNVLVLRQDGQVTGIVPFVARISRKFGVSLCRLQFASFDHEWDYNGFLFDGDAAGQILAVAEFLRRTAREWDVVDLRDLRDIGKTIEACEAVVASVGLSHRVLPEEERCPYMPITGSWEDTMQNHSRYTRRLYRRFKDLVGEGYRWRVVEDPSQEPALLDKMIALEAQKHVGGEQSVPFLGRHPKVFRQLFDSLGPAGWMTVVVLEHGERLIAWNIVYRCGKKLWGYMTAYDHAYSAISPGTVLIAAVIDYGFANGFDEFDFLNGEEPYKLRWTTGYHQIHHFVIWNERCVSRLRAYRTLRNARRELARRVTAAETG